MSHSIIRPRETPTVFLPALLVIGPTPILFEGPRKNLRLRDQFRTVRTHTGDLVPEHSKEYDRFALCRRGKTALAHVHHPADRSRTPAPSVDLT